jgi:hypothetical protein
MDRQAKPEPCLGTEAFVVEGQGGTYFADEVVHDAWLRFALWQY